MSTSLMRAVLCLMAIVGLGCCGGGIPPSSVAAEAHAVASLASGARGDLQQCTQQPDGGACAQVNTDLCDVIAQAKELEGLAVDAGFTPAEPVVMCQKK